MPQPLGSPFRVERKASRAAEARRDGVGDGSAPVEDFGQAF